MKAPGHLQTQLWTEVPNMRGHDHKCVETTGSNSQGPGSLEQADLYVGPACFHWGRDHSVPHHYPYPILGKSWGPWSADQPPALCRGKWGGGLLQSSPSGFQWERRQGEGRAGWEKPADRWRERLENLLRERAVVGANVTRRDYRGRSMDTSRDTFGQSGENSVFPKVDRVNNCVAAQFTCGGHMFLPDAYPSWDGW